MYVRNRGRRDGAAVDRGLDQVGQRPPVPGALQHLPRPPPSTVPRPPGYSSGQAAQAMEELALGLPAGYAYEWTGGRVPGEKRPAARPDSFSALSLAFVFSGAGSAVRELEHPGRDNCS